MVEDEGSWHASPSMLLNVAAMSPCPCPLSAGSARVLQGRLGKQVKTEVFLCPVAGCHADSFQAREEAGTRCHSKCLPTFFFLPRQCLWLIGKVEMGPSPFTGGMGNGSFPRKSSFPGKPLLKAAWEPLQLLIRACLPPCPSCCWGRQEAQMPMCRVAGRWWQSTSLLVNNGAWVVCRALCS